MARSFYAHDLLSGETKGSSPDPRLYALRPYERLGAALLGLLAGGLLGWLFFSEWWGLFPGLAGMVWTLRDAARRKEEREKAALSLQLRDHVLAVAALLRSGYALENAMLGAAKETRTIHGEACLMAREALRIEKGLALKVPPEKLWTEFAARTDLKEAKELARVLGIAKHEGGDYLPTLRSLARAMDARRQTREEVETVTAGQRLEYRIMCLVPAGILAYLRMAAPELAEWLFTDAGHLFMGAVLLLYAGAFAAGNRILKWSREGV